MRSVAFLLWLFATVLRAAQPDVLVLDGIETTFMRDALKRIACPFERAANPDASLLQRYRTLILSGKGVSAEAKVISAFLQGGGQVLAVGGSAKWMLDAKLFDATGYYPSGTTEHFSTFAGYHRVTFSYPVDKAADNWTEGVPSLLRATGGPLMRLGPKATSILSAGGPFSLAAFQRVGKGIALLIGPDPQGGNEVQSLGGKPVPKRGDALLTDALLANAIAWLRDPSCNLIPNSGFEVDAESRPEKSHWEIGLNKGATSQWVRQDAPEGAVFLRLVAPANGSATVTPLLPIAVERGATYRFACRYKSTAAASLMARHLVKPDDNIAKLEQHHTPLPPSPAWTRFETKFTMPVNCSYLKLNLLINKPGELSVDDVTLNALLP